MIVVDDAYIHWRGGRWCHLRSDRLDGAEALHAFAQSIGLRRSWFQGKSGQPWTDHYDVAPSARARAVASGAREITCAEMSELTVRLMREARAAATTEEGATRC